MQFIRFAQSGVCLLMLFFAAGCTTYYRITDQPTRRAYFATGYDRTDSGAVKFYDVKSRSNVTLQSSEIIEISRDAFDSGIRQ